MTYRPTIKSRLIKQGPGTRKLDEEQVRKIKGLLAEGLGTVELAARFNVARTTIYDIKSGRNWGHVSIEEPVAIPNDIV